MGVWHVRKFKSDNAIIKGIAKSHRLVGHHFPISDSNLAPALEVFSVLELGYFLPLGPIRPRIQLAEETHISSSSLYLTT